MADDTVTVEAPVFQGPALSATSDAPVIETPAAPPPENTEVNTAAAKAEGDAPEVAEGDDGATGAETGEEIQTATDAGKKDETPPWMKRELTKARNRQREAEDRARQSDARLDAALKGLEKVSTPDSSADTKSRVAVETPRPKRETFDNPDAYDAALVEWAADNAAKSAAARVRAEEAGKAEKARTDQADAERRKQQEQRAESWSEKRAKFMKDHEDFEDVAESDDLKISPVMTEMLLEADNGPELAYALGKDPELASRISQLSPAKAALEMGRFAASVEAAKRPKVSKTPPPVKPIGSRANAGQKTPDEMSMEEYAAMRTPQIIAERLGPMARQRAN